MVISCDLQGFSRLVAHSPTDLEPLLRRVNAALGIITQSIFDQEGIIADFQGDSALGFWGWPVAWPNAAVRACLC